MPQQHWVIDFDPFVIRFSEHIGVRYYGLAYVAGFLAAAWMLFRYIRVGRARLSSDAVGDLIVALVMGVLLGGRIGHYLLYDGWRTFPWDPWGIIRVWDGGMASHGGMIGVAVALAWFGWRRNLSFLHLGDLIVSVAPLGLFFGRIANFINGELWGKVSDVPWAMIFPLSAPRESNPLLIPPRHPSQLYEAGLEGIVLFAYMQYRFWRGTALNERPGQLAGEFLIAYGALRWVGELFREPDAALIFGMNRGIFYSLFLFIVGAVLIAWARRHPVTANQVEKK